MALQASELMFITVEEPEDILPPFTLPTQIRFPARFIRTTAKATWDILAHDAAKSPNGGWDDEVHIIEEAESPLPFCLRDIVGMWAFSLANEIPGQNYLTVAPALAHIERELTEWGRPLPEGFREELSGFMGQVVRKARERCRRLSEPCPDVLKDEGFGVEVREIADLAEITFETGAVHIVSAGLGTGKTTVVGNAFCDQFDRKVAALTHRVSLTHGVQQILGLGRHYQEKDRPFWGDDDHTKPGVSVCINSLIRDRIGSLVKRQPAILIDEGHAVLDAIALGRGAGGVMRQAAKVYQALCDLLTDPEKTILMLDANTSYTDVLFMLHMAEKGGKPCILYHLPVTPTAHEVIVHPSTNALRLHFIRNRKTVGGIPIYSADTKRAVKMLGELDSDLSNNGLLITSDLSDMPANRKLVQDPNGEVGQYVALAHSPSIETGVSFTHEAMSSVGWLEADGNALTFQALDQMHPRNRRATCWHISLEQRYHWGQPRLTTEQRISAYHDLMKVNYQYHLAGFPDGVDSYTRFREIRREFIEESQINARRYLLMLWQRKGYALRQHLDDLEELETFDPEEHEKALAALTDSMKEISIDWRDDRPAHLLRAPDYTEEEIKELQQANELATPEQYWPRERYLIRGRLGLLEAGLPLAVEHIPFHDWVPKVALGHLERLLQNSPSELSKPDVSVVERTFARQKKLYLEWCYYHLGLDPVIPCQPITEVALLNLKTYVLQNYRYLVVLGLIKMTINPGTDPLSVAKHVLKMTGRNLLTVRKAGNRPKAWMVDLGFNLLALRAILDRKRVGLLSAVEERLPEAARMAGVDPRSLVPSVDVTRLGRILEAKGHLVMIAREIRRAVLTVEGKSIADDTVRKWRKRILDHPPPSCRVVTFAVKRAKAPGDYRPFTGKVHVILPANCPDAENRVKEILTSVFAVNLEIREEEKK